MPTFFGNAPILAALRYPRKLLVVIPRVFLSRLTRAALVSAAVAAVAACGSASGSAHAPSCPAAWKAGWQKIANRIDAPVYCPSWMPQPLDGQIGGAYSRTGIVEPDRSYLVPFIWAENTGSRTDEVHVNFRGYPGRTAIPTCEDTLTVKGKTVHPKSPCFADSRGQKRFGSITITLYTANQGSDQWHALYAWRYNHSLYTVSEHVAPPFSYPKVIANLDRMMRGLVLIRPS
jgi:hypothetical protein